MSFWMDFLLGGLSAAVSKLGAGPVNRAKIVHQAQGELLRQGRLGRPYGGLADALARTVRAEGPLSLWRGAMYDVISYFPTQALNFALKDSFKKLFPFDRRQHGYGLWFFGNIMSGGLAGATSLLIVTPLQLATTVLAADVLAPELGRTTYQYTGMADVISKTFQHSGPLGLFNGFGVSVAGIVLYRGAYFGLYDTLRPLVPQNNFLASFLVGWGVTIAAGLATYPLDTIRRRMMIAGATPMAYSSALECTLTIWREEGVAGFFRGALSNIVRAIIGAMILVLYDQLQAALTAPPAPTPAPAANGDSE